MEMQDGATTCPAQLLVCRKRSQKTATSFLAHRDWGGVFRWLGSRLAVTRQPFGAGVGRDWQSGRDRWRDRALAGALAWNPGI